MVAYYGHIYDSFYGDVTVELRGWEWLRAVLVLRTAIVGRSAMGEPLAAVDVHHALSSCTWRYDEMTQEALQRFLRVQHWYSRSKKIEVEGYSDFPLVRNGTEES